MKRSLLSLILLVGTYFGMAQTNPAMWVTRTPQQVNASEAQLLHHFATQFRLVELTTNELASNLLATHKQLRQVALPTPNGGNIALTLSPVAVMHPELAARYPGIQTYTILPQGKTILGGRAGWTYQGFHATVRTTEGTIYIDPYLLNDSRYYVVYKVEDNIDSELWSGFVCGVTGHTGLDVSDIYTPEYVLERQEKTITGEPLQQRKYRLAMACTGEFAQFHGGTTEGALSAIVTIVNRVNDIFGRDLAVQLELIPNNDLLVFLNPMTDPYVNETASMLDANPGVLDSRVGNAAYDMGHVISTGPSVGQGVASLRGVCRAQLKGRATSTRATPQGDPFVVNILAHEMGHQMGATHVQSGCQNVEPSTAVEPGGGTTIMGYAGICPSGYNIQTNSDPYYNATSIQQIITYMRTEDGNACAQLIDEGNTLPEVNFSYTNGFFIPISTPFALTAEGTDMDNDELTYCWEQRNNTVGYPYNEDAGDYGPFPGMPVGNSPLFRTFLPTTSPTRIFPRIQRIVANTSSIEEVLPTYSRDLNFRCSVRDNHPTSGGVSWRDVAFRSAEQAGPFLVTYPNEASDVWTVGDYTEVRWDVANTNTAPVNCRRVNIRLSTDGGFTYPILLLADTPNDGSAFVTVPDVVATNLRVMVQAADNIFFDISNRNFSIVPATEPGYTLSYGPLYQEVCVPENTVSVQFETGAVLDYAEPVNFEVVSTLPAGATAAFSANGIAPGAGTTLTLDLGNTAFDGFLTVEVRAIAGSDTTFRVFDVEVYNNDFSAFALLSPTQGTTGIVLSTGFSWTALPNAQLYDFELATSPAFGAATIHTASNLAVTSYTPTILLEASTLFYWRVRPINECGAGPWSQPFVFQTQNVSCDSYASTDTPVTIPGTGPLPTRVSRINVGTNGIISDINIPYAEVRYQPIQNFQIRLKSPAGTQVLLYDRNCIGTDLVNIGFDDDAPLGIQCPPTQRVVYRPSQALSAFIGESTQGTWELEVQVLQTGFGAAGRIAEWAVEFCAANVAVPISFVSNAPLCVRPNTGGVILRQLLEADSPAGSNPTDLVYTVVDIPTAGNLLLQGQPLQVGGTFTQASVNAGSVSYVNTNGAATQDAFSFVVQEGTGAFIPVTTYPIVIDGACTVGTREVLPDDVFRIYPNPTRDAATLSWAQALPNGQLLRVYNLQGQLISQQPLPAGTTQHQLATTGLPAGVYMVQIGTYTAQLVKE